MQPSDPIFRVGDFVRRRGCGLWGRAEVVDLGNSKTPSAISRIGVQFANTPQMIWLLPKELDHAHVIDELANLADESR